MLPRKQRIGKHLFQKILVNKGFFIDSPHLSLRIFKAEEGDSASKFACLVSKKVAPSAVSRNRLRRMCYRTLSEVYSSLPHSILGIISLKKGSASLKKEELVSELKQALTKVPQL